MRGKEHTPQNGFFFSQLIVDLFIHIIHIMQNVMNERFLESIYIFWGITEDDDDHYDCIQTKLMIIMNVVYLMTGCEVRFGIIPHLN